MITRGIFLFFIVFNLLVFGYSDESEHKTETSTSISGLSWYLNIETALQKAKKEKKSIVVMVGEESCKWCKKMKNRTLIDTRIQAKLKSYILVSVKRSDKEAMKYLPTFDGNIPSFFFMQDNKELIESIVGYYKANDFLDYLNEVEE